VTRRTVVIVVALVVLGALAVPAGAATDADVAKAGVLVLTDFPSGWTQSPRAKSSDAALDAAAAKVKSCAPFSAFTKANRKNPRAESPNFDEQQSNVTNSVSIYPSTARAVAAMHTFSDRRLPSCLRTLFTSTFREELTRKQDVARRLASVRTTIKVVPGVEIGDEAVAYQGAVEVALKDGTSQTIGLGVVAARVGDAVTGYSWTADADISAALQPAIVTSVGRLQAAQSAGRRRDPTRTPRSAPPRRRAPAARAALLRGATSPPPTPRRRTRPRSPPRRRGTRGRGRSGGRRGARHGRHGPTSPPRP
jgi:hypothetical protein